MKIPYGEVPDEQTVELAKRIVSVLVESNASYHTACFALSVAEEELGKNTHPIHI